MAVSAIRIGLLYSADILIRCITEHSGSMVKLQPEKSHFTVTGIFNFHMWSVDSHPKNSSGGRSIPGCAKSTKINQMCIRDMAEYGDHELPSIWYTCGII